MPAIAWLYLGLATGIPIGLVLAALFGASRLGASSWSGPDRPREAGL
jgi:hypothetical protein